MRVAGTNIYMTRGDTESIGVKVSGYALKEGDYIEFTVRRSATSPVVLYKKEDTFGEDNSFLIKISPEDTSYLRFGNYIYDIQLTYSGSVKTIIRPSMFVIEEEVTYGN